MFVLLPTFNSNLLVFSKRYLNIFKKKQCIFFNSNHLENDLHFQIPFHNGT